MPKGIFVRKPFTKVHKKNISKAKIGSVAWNKGLKGWLKHTEESKRKMSEASLKRGARPPNNSKPKVEKICEYCGKIYEVLPHEVNERQYCSIFCSSKGKNSWNLGKHHTYEWRLNLSLKRKGKNNPSYIDGRNKLNRRSRRSLRYKIWREKVFKRDNYTCIWCGARNGNGKNVVLQADHNNPWALYPKLRYKVDNGRTLCISCHKKTDSYKKNIKL
ncbi:MAG TPA: hypothetical protein DCS09_00290 [Porphyromonadaceae bacterium]|nr:hypothetical protein [Porphyromonadaceae bacterium]